MHVPSLYSTYYQSSEAPNPTLFFIHEFRVEQFVVTRDPFH